MIKLTINLVWSGFSLWRKTCDYSKSTDLLFANKFHKSSKSFYSKMLLKLVKHSPPVFDFVAVDQYGDDN